MVTRQEILNCNASFGWDFGQKFFVETPYGNFVWSDPDYSGDNTFTKVNKSLLEWLGHPSLYVRDKGIHTVSRYCGEDIVVIVDGKVLQ